MSVSSDRWSCPLCRHTVLADHLGSVDKRRDFLAAQRDAHPASCRGAKKDPSPSFT